MSHRGTKYGMAASHLLICFCATAGKNGEEIGVDEQQIVLFVSLLFDVTNCKVSYLSMNK